MKTPDFEKSNGLLPAIIQDAETLNVLMLGYMSKESLKKTEDEGLVCFFSRSKNRLWTKGESSGNFLKVKEILFDCDQDCLLILSEPTGPVCHTGTDSCFGFENNNHLFLNYLEKVIENRALSEDEKSYTKKLLSSSLDRVAQKVGEEAIEVVIASKNDDKVRFREEVADLMYHLLILLRAKGVKLQEISDELMSRHTMPKN
ncbi:MAG: bifunctional phosphoribosyl-AMP cyclohydrolase/phosphoribosyl-ATP diphosphatase [Bacteroidetes bacterium HGW-Bacteroidetes-1]|jgi:phosphoribosyl-ATP pyrophosphohydrolase/phosphoribosyl-AMP cyclohydrolase|nr:MAG: bifunctional phosphoribosyl-AMP cyclohydrolase/phosphoribosyl-ATP diphosphatase [Bacteroidetes bacterium HGW-Bacteroidetes-1]